MKTDYFLRSALYHRHDAHTRTAATHLPAPRAPATTTALAADDRRTFYKNKNFRKAARKGVARTFLLVFSLGVRLDDYVSHLLAGFGTAAGQDGLRQAKLQVMGDSGFELLFCWAWL